jgi:hypothetical protein
MTVHSATIDVRADAATIRRVLLDPSAVPQWNPAISSAHTRVTEASPGVAYAVTVKSFVRGTLTYGTPGSAWLVEYELRAPGASERGSWMLRGLDGGTTRVEHSFEHGGFVLSLMSGAFEQVAGWRLARLKSFAEGRRVAG